MFWCLLASAVFGGLIGWGIKGLLASARDRVAEERNRTQLTAHQGQLRQETERYRALEGEHTAMADNLRNRDKEVLGLGESIRTLTESRDSAAALRATALKELESSKLAFTALQGDATRARGDLEAQLEAAKADARKHEASVADYSKRLTETTGFLNQSKHALEVHQKDYDDLVARHRLVEALPTTVKAHEETIVALRKQLAEAQTASNDARSQRENLAKEKAALDVRVAELTGQLERGKQELSTVNANHASTLQGKTQAENNLTQKIAAFVALEASMLALRKQSEADGEGWKSKFSASEQASTTARQQLAEKTKQYDATHAELLQARTQLESARRDTGTAQQRVSQLEAAARTAGEQDAALKRKLSELEAAARTTSEQDAALKRKLSELEAAARTASEHDAALKRKLSEAEAAVQTREIAMTQLRTDAEAQRAKVAAAERSAAEAQSKLSTQSTEIAQLTQQLNQRRSDAEALRTQLTAAERAVTDLKTQHERTASDWQARFSALQTAAETSKTQLQAREQALTAAQSEAQASRTRLTETERSITQLRADADAARARAATFEKSSQEASEALRLAREESSRAAQRANEWQAKHAASESAHAETQKQIPGLRAQWSQADEAAKARTRDVESWKVRYTELERKWATVAGKDIELERLRAQLVGAQRDATALEARLKAIKPSTDDSEALRKQLELRERRIRELETLLAAHTTKPAPTVVAKPAAPKPIAKPAAPKAVAKPTIPGAKERDDLKAIFGVGPVLEKFLHKHGVYWFREVAAWTKADIERFEEMLPNFKGRIHRENWMGSARDEHKKKYGTFPEK